MQKQNVKSNINLESLAAGAFAEKLNEALMQVAENIQNPNTEATTKRQIQVLLKFSPNKTRQLVSTQISVTTKLAATEAIDTQMIMGLNIKTGEIEIAEYNGQIRGQMSLSDFQKPAAAEQPEPVQQNIAEIKEATQAAGAQPEQQPTGRPLDLKNRNKQQAPVENQDSEKTEPAAGELIPGIDFDPDTGEVLENGRPMGDHQTTDKQPEDESKKIVSLGQRVAQG